MHYCDLSLKCIAMTRERYYQLTTTKLVRLAT